MDKNDIILDLRERTISNQKKEDFKTNKKEEFLFNFFEKSSKKSHSNFNLNIMDTDSDSKKIITRKEVQQMLSNKDFQKKNISEEDLIMFLNKLQELNPTKKETFVKEIQNNYKDESGNGIMSEEITNMFGFERTNYEYANKDGTVKKGFECFDLNSDGKIDNLEKEFIISNNMNYSSNLEDFKNYYRVLDEIGSDNGKTKDGIITKADMQKMYDTLIDNYNKKLRETLANITIKQNNKNVVTNEIIELFNNTTEITASDIVDKNGYIKQGLEIFDLNNDSKFDDIERNYFASGGHPRSDNEEISLNNFISSVEQLDEFETYQKSNLRTFKNNNIHLSDKIDLYKMLEGTNFILENMDKFPDELQAEILTSLKEVFFVQNSEKFVNGVQCNDRIAVDKPILKQKGETAAIVLHELTHYILDKSNVPPLLQEVETFYMEYKLYENCSIDNQKYFYEKDDPYFRHCIISQDYSRKISELRRKEPDVSEKELAVQGFIAGHFSSYNGKYCEQISAAKLKEQYFELGDKSIVNRYFSK